MPAYSADRIDVERHREVRRGIRASGRFRRNRTVWLSSFLDCVQQVGHAEILEIVVARARDPMERMVLLPLPHQREEHVVGVHLAGRLEHGIAVELHAAPEPEHVFRSVLRHGPRLGQARHESGRAGLELDEGVEHRPSGIDACRRGHDLRIQRFGIALGAEDQRLRRGRMGEEKPRSVPRPAIGGSCEALHVWVRSVRAADPAGCIGRSMVKRVPCADAGSRPRWCRGALAVTRL